ncbi:hypothetical protein O7635_29620 [Asanoa sp. WMMD1127]|uniref:hypothetical protein n=1 Tax=Asanoa sp. WMMD1127 TaxID=3016107 RepID=UPI0024170BD7|nr:hypothetical protein [Asanoa sp. WMMD1127]MDG4826029.1 hypothetical protein [Asanoa sp. WMMD1127]
MRKARVGGAWFPAVRKVRLNGQWITLAGGSPEPALPYVRAFDGIDDEIVTGVGALSAMTHGTVAFIMKRTGSGAVEAMFAPHSSDGTFRGEVGTSTGNAWQWYSGAASIGGALTNNRWFFVVARKPAGTSTPRFSSYDYTGGTWQHVNGANARAAWTPAGVGGSIKMSAAGSDFPLAKVAVRAAWSNALPFAADTAGDAAIEASGMHLSAAAWLTRGPNAMWLFNQADISTPVPDITGGGANQTAITGTSVDTTDPPPGFNFAIS